MALEKGGILVDASMNLTGLSASSVTRIKKAIQESILTDNKIKLSFDAHGKSALLNGLDVVYDKVNDIKKIAASVKIGNTNYKFFINDYEKVKESVLKINKTIDGQEKQILNIKNKGANATDKEKQKLEELNDLLDENIKKRERIAKPLIKDNSLTGNDKYRSANLNTSVGVKTTSKTKIVSDEKLLNEQYSKQAYLIKQITRANKENSKSEALRFQSELDDAKKETRATEARIKNKYHNDKIPSDIISKAKAPLTKALDEARISNESKVVKDREKSLNQYLNKLKEIEKYEKALAYAQEKYNASAKNRTTEASEYIDLNKEHLSQLKSEADKQLEQTNVKYRGESFDGNKTNEYNEALKQQAIHLHNVKNAQAEASAAYSKSNNLLGIMSENFKTAAARIIDYTIVYRGLWLVMQKVQQAIQTVVQLNKAFTDIQIVTDYTDSQMQNLSKTMTDLAKSTGSTLQQVAEGSVEWLRQGKTVAETNYLLKESMIASKIGMLDSAQAVEILTSTLNGYQMSVGDASKIVDVFATLDMKAATSFKELGVAFTKTANSAKDAGVGFETLAAYITTVSEVTRKSASTIGESFKTIFARFQNVKLDKVMKGEAGEIGINDTEKALSSLGITMRKSETEWRSMEDVMAEVGSKWKDFDQLQKNTVVTALAGVRQAENMRALFNNWDKVIEYTGVAMNSAGTAAKKYAIYLDSIEGRMNTMTATFQDLVHSEQFENLIKMVLSFATALGETLNAIGAANIALFAFSLGMGALITKLLPAIKMLGVSIPGALSLLRNGIMALTGAEAAATASMATFISTTLPIAGIVAVISILVYSMYSYKSATEQAVESIKSLKSEQEDAENSIESINAQLEENKTRWEELKAVKTDSSNADLIQEEKDGITEENELLKIQKEYYEAIADAKNAEAKQKARELLNPTNQFGKNNNYTNKTGMSQTASPVQQANDLSDTLDEQNTKLLNMYKKAAKMTDEERDKSSIDKKIEKQKKLINDSISKAGDIDLETLMGVFSPNDPEYKTIANAEKNLTKGLANGSKATAFVGKTSEMTSDQVEDLASSMDDATEASADTEDGAVELIGTLSDAVDAMSAVKDAQKELNDDGTLSWDTISNLANKYPELTSSLLQYTQGIISNDEMTKILNDTLAQQGETLKSNLEESEDYYTKMILSNKDLYNKFLNDYKIDLGNFSSISDLKLEIDKLLKDESGKIFDQRVADLAAKYQIDVGNYANAAQAKLKIEQELRKSNATAMSGNGVMPEVDKATGVIKYNFKSPDLTKQQKKDIAGLGKIDPGVSTDIDASIASIADIAKGVGSKSSASDSKDSGSKDTEDKWKEAFEKEYNTIQYWRDKEWITEKDYYLRLEKLNNKYFLNREKYTEDYRQYDIEVQEGLLKVYEDLFTKRLDKSKDYIEDKNYYDNWGADNEIEAWTRVLKWMKSDFYPENLKQKEIYDKNYKEATKNLITSIESDFDKQLSDSEHGRKIYKFETDKTDLSSVQDDLDKISDIITKGYYEIDGEVVDITEERMASLQDSWMELHEERVSALEDEKSDMEDVLSAATNLIDKEIDKLDKKRDIIEQTAELDSYIIDLNKSKYEALMGNEYGVAESLQSQIDYINEQKNIIDSLNDDDEKRVKLREVQLEIQNRTVDKLKEELKLIQNQKTQRVYSAEKGWMWTSDRQAELDKEQAILDAQTQAQTKAIDNQIEDWNDYKKAWEDVVDDYKLQQDELLLDQKLGADIESDILDKRIDAVESFKDRYLEIMEQINEASAKYNELTVPTKSEDSPTAGSKSYNGVYYNASVDYQQRINDAISSGQDQSVIDGLTAQRDAKIAGENLNSDGSKKSSSSGGKTVTADSKTGNAPAGTKVGDTVKTAGGTYKVVAKGTPGSTYNKSSGLSSIKIKHDGIETGLVGDVPFDPNTEVLAKLAKGEGVFNEQQMKNMVRNMSTIFNTSFPSYSSREQSEGYTQTVYIDTIELPNVPNANEFVKQLRNIVAITGK